ncbi:MAG: sugar phosphate isomerase/epimerase [Chloroflexi bacterium]|nr:sugar phosphate isomerase/epimerase [Chloroflexota bacterium]MCL5273944.1 sugar phosphate isomerase/epimerase [Chloroflexota bacterium]
MDIICASICYRGYATDEVAATFANAPRIGYRMMEIHGPMTWSVDAVKAFNLQSIKTQLARSGLRCAGIYTPGWGGKDDDEVRRHADAIAMCVRYAEALGAHHVVSTGVQPRGDPRALERIIACVRCVLEQITPACPVKLTLEPHYGNTLQQPEDFQRILDAVADPRVGVCVDTGHFHSAHVDTAAAIRQFAPRLYAVHLKDHVGTTSVGIGRGEIDLKHEIEALQYVGYIGDLTVELEVEDPQNLPRYSEEAYVYLSGVLGRKL